MINDHCTNCGERFEREPGQWFGSIYVNLGLTLGLASAGYLLLQMLTSLTTSQQLQIWTTVAVTGPFAFYRLSKGLWISMVFLGEGLYIQWPNQTKDATASDRLRRKSAQRHLYPVS